MIFSGGWIPNLKTLSWNYIYIHTHIYLYIYIYSFQIGASGNYFFEVINISYLDCLCWPSMKEKSITKIKTREIIEDWDTTTSYKICWYNKYTVQSHIIFYRARICSLIRFYVPMKIKGCMRTAIDPLDKKKKKKKKESSTRILSLK